MSLRNFTPDSLTEVYIQLYKFEYGEKKLREVVSKVEESSKVKKYLFQLLENNIEPTGNGIQILMNSLQYFLFSKEETLCLGGLATIILWKDMWYIYNNSFDNEIEIRNFDSRVLRICIELIEDCRRNKYNKGENFFSKFDRIINQVNQK